MEKIPTLFHRDEKTKKVIDVLTPGCEWVRDGEGVATEKLDGTNVRLTVRSGIIVRVEKRRNPTKEQKAFGIIDPWYVDTVKGSSEDKWIWEAVGWTAVGGSDEHAPWPDGEHSCEAIGPSIQGNPLGLEKNTCVPFNLKGAPVFYGIPRTFDGLKEFLAMRDSLYSPGHLAEGIVFHHPDGRRAKIKRKDF